MGGWVMQDGGNGNSPALRGRLHAGLPAAVAQPDLDLGAKCSACRPSTLDLGQSAKNTSGNTCLPLTWISGMEVGSISFLYAASVYSR